jgi:hypothetical protein
MVWYAKAALSLVALVVFPAASAHAAVLAFNGQFSNDTPTPGPDPSCAANQVLVSFNPGNSTAAGTSNFGNFGPSQSHCLRAGFPYTGTFNFAFVAGDALFGSTAGFLTPSATPGILNSFVTYTALGGTGRFLGASGTINGVGLLDRRPLRPLNALTLSGTLNLPAVPEPASWALLVAGFGLTGAVLRRQRTVIVASRIL